MTGSKRKARIYAMQALFAYDTEPSQRESLLSLGWLSDIQQEKLGEDLRFFIASLIEGCIANLAEIDAIVIKNLNNWDFSRINGVTRSLLRTATYEVHKLNTPPSIVVKEAAAIAKEYEGEDAAKFVQGVLNGVWNSLCEQREAQDEQADADEDPQERGTEGADSEAIS